MSPTSSDESYISESVLAQLHILGACDSAEEDFTSQTLSDSPLCLYYLSLQCRPHIWHVTQVMGMLGQGHQCNMIKVHVQMHTTCCYMQINLSLCVQTQVWACPEWSAMSHHPCQRSIDVVVLLRKKTIFFARNPDPPVTRLAVVHCASALSFIAECSPTPSLEWGMGFGRLQFGLFQHYTPQPCRKVQHQSPDVNMPIEGTQDSIALTIANQYILIKKFRKVSSPLKTHKKGKLSNWLCSSSHELLCTTHCLSCNFHQRSSSMRPVPGDTTETPVNANPTQSSS
jgi:hypothetical protein